jgi:hypothetical protein
MIGKNFWIHQAETEERQKHLKQDAMVIYRLVREASKPIDPQLAVNSISAKRFKGKFQEAPDFNKNRYPKLDFNEMCAEGLKC